MHKLWCLLLLPAICAGQIEKNLESLYAVRSFTQASISPDGKKLAWVERGRAKDRVESRDTMIYVVDLDRPSASPHRLTAGDGKKACEESGLAWSPDSKRIAFLSTCKEPGQRQLYVASAEGGDVRKLTSLTGFLSDPRWSPNGDRIALLFTENAVRAAGPLEPTAIETGVIEENFYEQRLALVDAESGKTRRNLPSGHLHLRVRLVAGRKANRVHRCQG